MCALFQGRIRYEIIGDFPAPYFFKIEETGGQIKVANNLTTDRAFSYKVRVFCVTDSVGMHCKT